MNEGQNAGILIVDNDHRIVELVAWFLKKRGYDVRTAATFVDARARIAERRPDLCLSDIDLGAESALDELPRLADEGLLPPTLVVSGYLDAAVVEALERLGPVLGTLAKPFDFAVLEKRVVECLDRIGTASSPGPRAAAGAPVTVVEDDDGWIEIVPHARRPSRIALGDGGSGDRGGLRLY